MQRTMVERLVVLAFGVLWLSLAVEAQSPTHMYRIGWLAGALSQILLRGP